MAHFSTAAVWDALCDVTGVCVCHIADVGDTEPLQKVRSVELAIPKHKLMTGCGLCNLLE